MYYWLIIKKWDFITVIKRKHHQRYTFTRKKLCLYRKIPTIITNKKIITKTISPTTSIFTIQKHHRKQNTLIAKTTASIGRIQHRHCNSREKNRPNTQDSKCTKTEWSQSNTTPSLANHKKKEWSHLAYEEDSEKWNIVCVDDHLFGLANETLSS